MPTDQHNSPASSPVIELMTVLRQALTEPTDSATRSAAWSPKATRSLFSREVDSSSANEVMMRTITSLEMRETSAPRRVRTESATAEPQWTRRPTGSAHTPRLQPRHRALEALDEVAGTLGCAP